MPNIMTMTIIMTMMMMNIIATLLMEKLDVSVIIQFLGHFEKPGWSDNYQLITWIQDYQTFPQLIFVL